MSSEPSLRGPSRPPVLLGCLGLLAIVAAAALITGACVVFLESGADSGRVTLRPVAAYPPGTVEFVGEENVFLVRTSAGALLALSDLDQANQLTPERRCRVQLTDLEDVDVASSRMSPDAAGAQVVLQEACNGAVYDIAGVRLDGNGANLDRHPVSLEDGTGRVVIDLRERQCTERTEDALRADIECPGAGADSRNGGVIR